jgi:hypothetical protein
MWLLQTSQQTEHFLVPEDMIGCCELLLLGLLLIGQLLHCVWHAAQKRLCPLHRWQQLQL